MARFHSKHRSREYGGQSTACIGIQSPGSISGAGEYPVSYQPREGHLSAQLVIGCFLGNLHIMSMTLTHTGTGNAHKSCLVTETFYCIATHVTHRRTQPTGQLMDDTGQGALVRHTAFNTFGHQFVCGYIHLEIAVLGAFLHRAE